MNCDCGNWKGNGLVGLDPVPGSKCWECGTPVSVDFSPFCCEECEFNYNKVGY